MIDENHPLAKAARLNDYEADAGKDAIKIAADLEIDTDALVYMAEQRALRVVLIQSGRLAEVQDAEMEARAQEIKLNVAEQAMMQMLTVMCLDGLVIGWRALRLQEGDE